MIHVGILHSMKDIQIKSKGLTQNNRNFLAIGIAESGDTKIYLHGVSKTTGVEQWYESNRTFTQSTAHKYYYAGQYRVALAGGITKSTVKGWW